MTFPCERPHMPCSASPASTRTGSSRRARRQLERLVEQLADAYERTCSEDWCWFEDELSYDNARLSQALLTGGSALGRPELTEIGLESLRWLGDECGLDQRHAPAPGSPRPPPRRAGAGRRRRAAARRRRARRSRAECLRCHTQGRARSPGDSSVRVVPGPQPPAEAALRLRDRRLQRRARQRSAERQRRRRVDARLPPRGAAPRRRRRSGGRPRGGARTGRCMTTRRALRAPPGQPDPDRRRLALSGERRLQPGGCGVQRRDRLARARRRPPRDLTPHRGPLGERRRRMDDRARAAARPRRRDRKRAMGIRGCADRLGRGARALGDHLHRLRPGRAGCLSRHDGGLRHRRAPRRRQAPGGQERRPPAAPDRRPLGAAPSPQDRVRRRARRDRSFPLGRPPELERPRTGAPTARRRLVGLATDRHRPPAAPHRARLAAPLPRRQGHRGRRDVSRGPRAARPRRTDPRPPTPTQLDPRTARATTSERATSPTSSFPPALLHDEASDEIRLYYGAADSSICLATARLRDLLDAVLAAPRET